MKTDNGYSLIEVMLVLAISMVLAYWVMPGMSAWFNRTNNEVLKAQLTQAIYFAQAESHHRYTPVGLRIEDGKGLSVFLEKNNQVIRHLPLHQQGGKLHLRSFPYYRDYLLFLPDGLVDNDNATLWYCYRHAASPAFALTLSKSGVVHAVALGKELTC